jgi:hypothetical protein
MSATKNIKKVKLPSDLKKGDTVKGLPDSALHFTSCLRAGSDAIMCFGPAPVLLNEVELAMVFGVEVTDVTAILDLLLEL